MQNNRKDGWLRTWEPIQKGKSGNLGCGVIVDPGELVDFTEGDGNYLVIAKAAAGQPAVYYAGFGWDRSGDFANLAEWDSYLQQYARRVRSPLKITISPQ